LTGKKVFNAWKRIFQTLKTMFKTWNGIFNALNRVFNARKSRFKTLNEVFNALNGRFKTRNGRFKTWNGQFKTLKGKFNAWKKVFHVGPFTVQTGAGRSKHSNETRQDIMPFYDTPGLTYDSGALYDDLTPPPSPNKKNMAKVKFTLKGVPDGDAIQTCSDLKVALTTNANFPAPPITPIVFGSLITAAQTALTASDNAAAASKQATTNKDTAIAAMAAAAMQLVGYVDLTANGDEAKILSAGLSVRAARTPQAVPGLVQNLSVTTSDNAGALDVHWDSLPGAKSFEVQTSADPFTPTSWVTADTLTNSKTTLAGFTSGAKIWVRARGINSAGKGAWSDPAVKVVP
jgi:hypothetical protein